LENLNIEATKYTPKVTLDVSGLIEIVGKSYPENTFEFYKPVSSWVEEYFENIENDNTLIKLDLEYLNSSSLKAYFDLFDLFEIAHNGGKKLEVQWIYDEENDIAEETGEDFMDDFEILNIKLLSKS